ncbi:expressed unknown protein [Seminavis robusta]|uniref:Uncharacterized protein n=1 Tax=Seminavis robusta TaxID=568900 RepID=A0A9N8HC63_9STRA|nr:expressed unknown protein [Seminavis robusta]|eukprot:Sro288_g108760.1 n/a (83) ;mRNA; r:28082-28403
MEALAPFHGTQKTSLPEPSTLRRMASFMEDTGVVCQVMISKICALKPAIGGLSNTAFRIVYFAWSLERVGVITNGHEGSTHK